MPEFVEFMLRPDVDSTVLHMCGFGLVGRDEESEASSRRQRESLARRSKS